MGRTADFPNTDLMSAIRHALALADELGYSDVAICLNEALVAVDGVGVSPPQLDLEDDRGS